MMCGAVELESEYAVVFDAVTKVYEINGTAVPALCDVTIGLAHGSFVAVMGVSGSGKSTLLRCAAGLEPPTSGSVSVDGADLSCHGGPHWGRVGFAGDPCGLLPSLTVGENVLLPARVMDRAVDTNWVDRVADRAGLAQVWDADVAALSCCGLRHAVVARALALQPGVVVADEPSCPWHAGEYGHVTELLREAADRKDQTVLMATNDPTVASCADVVLFFGHGRLIDAVACPTPRELTSQLALLSDC